MLLASCGEVKYEPGADYAFPGGKQDQSGRYKMGSI